MSTGRRSETTRATILDAARKRFATYGFRATTIRAVAADAGIDPSMVMRYFGSKAELFDTATDIDLRLPDLRGTPRSRRGRELVAHFLDRWEDDPDGDVLLVLVRSATVDEDAAHRMQAIFATQLAPAIAGLVDDPAEASERAGLIATQMLGLALGRHLLRLPPVAGLDRETIVTRLGATVQRYLHGR